MFLHYADRIPREGAVLVVSNHRSFMDAPLLMNAIDRPIRFACHHYMGQVPIMREIVQKLGCFPLEATSSSDHSINVKRRQSFFRQAIHLLQTRQVVGIFPEGAQPMLKLTHSDEVGEFHRGFAHLALRAPIRDLAILPIALCAQTERVNSAVPLKLLGFFDPSEPLFNQEGWHPMVVYQRVNVLVGRPRWITSTERQNYQGKEAKSLVADLTKGCHAEIHDLMQQGYY